MTIQERADGHIYKLSISIDSDGNKTFDYVIDGEHSEFTDATRQWYQEILRDRAANLR